MRLMVESSDLTMDCDKDANELRLFDRTPASDAFWKKHRADLIKSFDVVQMDNSGTRRYITLECNPSYFLWQDGKVWRHFDCDLDHGDVKVLAYSEEQWFHHHDTVKSTGERHHPGYKHLCSVLFNAFENPVILDRDTVSQRYIDRIDVHKESETDIVFKFRVASCAIETNISCGVETNEIVFSTKEKYTIIQKKDCYPTLLIDGKVTTAALDLIDLMTLLESQFYYKKCYSHHKDYMVIYRLLEPVINKWVVNDRMQADKDQVSVRLKKQLAQVYNNPRLYDLPFGEIELIGLYNPYKYLYRHNQVRSATVLQCINKSLADNNSKQAINACFYGYEYPKCIRKLLLQAGLLKFNERTYHLIACAVEAQGVDKTFNFITNPHKDGQLDLDVINDRELLNGFIKGWNLKLYRQMQTNPDKSRKEKTSFNTLDELLRDAVRMHDYLVVKKADVKKALTNIKDIHDYLSPIYSVFMQSDSGSEMEAFKTVSTTGQLVPLSIDGFTLRAPHTAFELMAVGRQMKSCVASYAKAFFYRQIDIALLTDNYGEYLACIEIKDGYVIQAKLKYNLKLKENNQYLQMVMEFMALNNLKIGTEDIKDHPGFGYKVNRNRRGPKDESRLALVQALKEKGNYEDGWYYDNWMVYF